MYKTEAVKYYGNQNKLAAALGVSDAAVSSWSAIIPEKQAGRLERLTNGQLSYSLELYQTTQTAQSEKVA